MDGQRSNSCLLQAALAYHAMGYPVIAVTKSKRPYDEGWNTYFARKQTEVEVRKQFSNGAYGLAIVLWPASPNAVLDFDGPHAREAWRQTGIELPATARMITGSGGEHLYFWMSEGELPEKLKRKIRLAKIECGCKDSDGRPKPCGVDLLIRGYAIVPPTPGYKEDPDYPLESAVVIPTKVLTLIQEKPISKQQITGGRERVRQGERNTTACSLAGAMVARGMSMSAIRVALKADNEQRFAPPLADKEIESILEQAEKWALRVKIKPENLTDLGNARRLVTLQGQDLRYSSQLGWLTWTGQRWEQDVSGVVERLAKATVRAIYREAAVCDDKDLREKIASHAQRSESDARIKAMIALARTEEEVIVRQADLDTDRWLLNVDNGSVNLKTGELRAHRREDLVTKVVPIAFDPEAVCPTWLCFLERVADGNQDLIRFVQKSVGYSLSGDTREQCFFILHGTGANGKSTFISVVSALLGDYAKQTRTETLMAKRGDQIPNDIARLAGARIVSAIETEGGRRLAESLVKQMTGGDHMTARFLHREFFEFEPTFKLWLAVNHKPRIVGTDHAIWRRIRLIPFAVTILENERDPDLSEKLKEELPGILAWAVRGCLAWQTQGLNPPKSITAATDQYRNESDVIASFLDECCKKGPDYEVRKAELYEHYMEWCQKSGERPLSKKEFGSRLMEKGFSDDRNRKVRFWRGIELENDAA